jgi:homoserine dehydrogenase
MTEIKKINIGLFGVGIVGSGLIEVLRRRCQQVKQIDGFELEITKAVVLDPSKKRKIDTTGIEISSDPDSILDDDSIDIVVELIGGIEVPQAIIQKALNKKKHVVSANKALLATNGEQLIALAEKQKCCLLTEAAVGGGIPILKTLREGFIGNDITSIKAILNGTSNFILTKMAEDGLSYHESLKMASDAGFAEVDPTMDVDGTDAQQKLRVLAAYICNGHFPSGDILYRGITDLTPSDFQFARQKKMTIKLLAKAKKDEKGLILKVEPTLLPLQHPLANIRNEYNAFLIEGDALGTATLSGKGAGSLPTASAVFADIVDICRGGTKIFKSSVLGNNSNYCLHSSRDAQSEYYLRFTVDDEPGMIGAITTALGSHQISVYSTSAELIPNASGIGQVHVLVHHTSENRIEKALEEIRFINGIHKEFKYLPIDGV